MHPDLHSHWSKVGGPQEVHRRRRHSDAPMRSGIIGDLVGPMKCDALVEVLRSINVAKISCSPAFFDLAIDHKNAVGSDGVPLNPLTPLVFVAFFEWDTRAR